ncbi:MAG: 2,3-bisphosphoglycerate-independent phosphoglycerate mutase [Thermodesulfobacteriota bacterium]
MSEKKGPLLLAILDGWGVGEATPTNAVFQAKTPNMDRWQRDYPATTLLAHNGAVGLPEGQMGNSEVGHLNIGAGRVVHQDFSRINRAVAAGELGENPELKDLLAALKASGGALHLLGLLSDGGVHSHLDHLLALVRAAVASGLSRIFIHAFMDGRDTPPVSGAGYMAQLEEALAEIGCGQVATISGRYWAMDRDNRWERVAQAWEAMVDGEGVLTSLTPGAAVAAAHGAGENDEFIKPMVLCQQGDEPLATINDGDGIIFFNFRADRARELTKAFTAPDFSGFTPRRRPKLAHFLTMTQYDATFALPALFPPLTLERILGEEISHHGLAQLRIAETEKYAHVTFFFNGGREEPFGGEERILIESPREVATYDEKPEMSAPEVTQRLLETLAEGRHDFIVLNFANADMVGHTGDLTAAIAACETVDQCLGQLVARVQELAGTVLITADHGNSDIMYDEEHDQPFTAHTVNPVPFILLAEGFQGQKLRSGGALKDIAPTVLNLLDLPVPAEMEGECLY